MEPGALGVQTLVQFVQMEGFNLMYAYFRLESKMIAARSLPVYALAGVLLAATAIAAINYSLPLLQAKIGTVVLSVSDSPPSVADASISKIYLKIDEIMLHRENNQSINDGRGWVNVTISAKTIELLSLRNLTENFPQLGTAKLPAGTYNLIWLNIDSAQATINGANETLKLPSGTLKIPLIRFTISDGGVTNILIDLGYDSIHVNKELILHPVAHILSQSHP